MVIDSTKLCTANKPLSYDAIKYLIIHRTDLEDKATGNDNPIANNLLTGTELVSRFKNPLLGTCGLIPYHFLIRYPYGQVEQLLPLSRRGAHAIGYNYQSIGVAVVGRLDLGPASNDQYMTLVMICADLARINKGLIIVGHTDLPGASADKNKHCPGKYLDISKLRYDVEQKNLDELRYNSGPHYDNMSKDEQKAYLVSRSYII